MIDNESVDLVFDLLKQVTINPFEEGSEDLCRRFRKLQVQLEKVKEQHALQDLHVGSNAETAPARD